MHVIVIYAEFYGFDTRMGHDDSRREVVALAKDRKTAERWVRRYGDRYQADGFSFTRRKVVGA